jgi:hypothetical protein
MDRKYYSFEKFVDTNNIYGKNLVYKKVDFYQIAIHKNPETNKYHLRKFTVDESNKFSDIKNYKLDEDNYKKLLKKLKSNEYKLYSVYTLDGVSYPDINDITLAQSDILCNNYDYTGYAPW